MPQLQGASTKSLVNLYSLDKAHFEDQSIKIKQLFYKYNAKIAVIDANGLGIGLVDYLVKPQADPETGERLPGFGVENDEDGSYKRFLESDTEKDALFLMKANASINTVAHSYVQTQLLNNKLKFLIDERQAKLRLLGTAKGKAMKDEQVAEYLMPFTMTTILREQMLNLIEQREGINVILDRSNTKIKKDKFSALEYALYYEYLYETKRKRKRKFDIKNYMFFS